MKATIGTAELKVAMQTIAKFIPAKSVKEILNNAKITFDKQTIFIEACDLTSFLIIPIQLYNYAEDVDAVSNSFLVKAKILFDVVKNITSHDVTFEYENSYLVIRTDTSKVVLPSLNSSAFPASHFENTDSCKSFTIAAWQLSDMLKRSVVFCSQDATPFGDSIKVGQTNSHVILETFNQFKYSSVQSDSGDEVIKRPLSISRHAAETLAALADSMPDSAITLYYSDLPGNVICSTPNFLFKIREIMHEFPNAENFFPKSAKSIAYLDRKIFLTTLKLLTAVSEYAASVQIKPSMLSFIGKESAKGEAGIDVVCETFGDEMKVYVHPKNLLEVIAKFTEEKITIAFDSNKTPIVLYDGDNRSKTDTLQTVLITPTLGSAE